MRKLVAGVIMISLILSCNSSSETSTDKNYLFEKVPSEISNIEFSNTITEDPEHNILNYIYYYNGAGVAAGDVNNDSLVDLFFVSNSGPNRLYLNRGNMEFEDVTENANLTSNASWNTGATMIDINSDGLLDIYVSAVSGLLDFKGHNELFINNGDGTFTESAKEYGLDFKGYTTQAYFFDYDKDADLDVYLVNHAIHTTLSHGSADVRDKRVPLVGDVLLKNENGKFIDASEEANIYGGVNGYGLSASIADFNNDGWDDIYVANDFHEDDYYYINNQDGTFSEQLDKSFSTISRFSMGTDAADINGDGYQDLITLDMLPEDEKVVKESEGDDAMYNMQKRLKRLGYKDQYARNMLQLNNSGEYFQEVALYNNVAATDWSWGPLLADFNNDGHTDLFISNGILRRPNDLDFKKYVSAAFKDRAPNEGVKWLYQARENMPEGKVSNEIFEGNSSRFTSRTGDWIEEAPSLSNGAVYTDLDLDGDLDIVLNNLNEEAAIYENTTDTTGNFLNLQFQFKGQNINGIGTKAIVFSNGHRQTKQMFSSRGFLSSTDSKLHFGIGKNKVDSIHIIWPDNQYQRVINPEINQQLKIVYDETLLKEYDYSKPKLKTGEFEKVDKLAYIHREDRYDDFLNEKLIPYKVSTMGPAMDIGDIDNNGFPDVFLGNSSGRKAQLFLNNGRNLEKADLTAIELDSVYEDNDAVFFDADNDDDLDLYVASGINKYGKRVLMNDRLYINENGDFKKSAGQIPDNLMSSATVSAGDYDKDGDQDLFIGNISNPGNFGEAVNSFILVNDGKGNFSQDTSFSLRSHVTSSKWEDIDEDGYPELLVSVEWDSPKIYKNNKGKLTEMSLPQNLNGLWQSVAAYDVDEDGDKDILLGNWGLNTRFNPSEEAPLKMYHSDFNSDGKQETVLAYNRNGKYYPVNSRDELASQTNFISKKFPSHKEFSLKTVEEVFTPEAISRSNKYEVHNLASGYLVNEDNEFKNFTELPAAFQVAPINSFDKLSMNGEPCVLVSGNTYKVNTYHGGYSALKGMLMKNISDYKPATDFGLEPFDEQIKKTATLKMRNENLLLVLSNNDSLKAYSYSR